MMGPICWSLALPILLGAAQDDPTATWKTYSSKNGRYSVKMPSEPTKKEQTVELLKVRLRIAEGRHDSFFVVSYCDFAAGEVKKGEEDKRLDKACKGAVEKSGGVRKMETKINLDGKYPGRELVIEKKGEIIAKMRIYLVGSRLYQMMVLGDAKIFAAKENDVSVFLDSFRLNK